MLPLRVDYEAGSLALLEGDFALARGRAGQVAIVDVTRRRVIGSAVIGEDGKVACSNELAERIVDAWVGYCSAHAREPWPRPGSP